MFTDRHRSVQSTYKNKIITQNLPNFFFIAFHLHLSTFK